MKHIAIAIFCIMAMVVSPASAWEGNVDVNVNCMDYAPFVESVALSSDDNFILHEGESTTDLKIDAQVGDINGWFPIINSVTYKVEMGSSEIIPETEFQDTTFVFPWLRDCNADIEIPAAEGEYTVTVTVYDWSNEASQSETFTVTSEPAYEISSLELGEVEPGQTTSGEFTVTNNYGPDNSYVDNVAVQDIVLNDDNYGQSTIPAENITVTLPEGTFAPGESVTVEVSIDLSETSLGPGESVPEQEWTVTILEMIQEEPAGEAV